MFSKESPIGIIDSGIGGFSVARKVQKLLPRENLVYLGDGANTPYGNHTAEEILTMTRYMLRFMEEKGVKALLVACNTISCLIDQYRDEMSCPVLSFPNRCRARKSSCWTTLCSTFSPSFLANC